MPRLLLMVLSVLVVAGCVQPNEVETQGDSPRLISAEEARLIPMRHVGAINEARRAFGLQEVSLDLELTVAARTHAQDMSIQRRVWHFGSDGSSPIERVSRSGFDGRLIGENIAETFENDTEILEAWLREHNSRSTILHPDARSVGFGWKQDEDGKLWWVQLVGA